MISIIGLLGKLSEFLANELSKRKLARDADKKGQACEAFTRLYFLLADLQSITDFLEEGAKLATEQSHPYIPSPPLRL